MQQPAPSPKPSLFPYILISLIFIAASAGMYYLSQNLAKSPKIPFLGIISPSTPTPTPTQAPTPTEASPFVSTNIDTPMSVSPAIIATEPTLSPPPITTSPPMTLSPQTPFTSQMDSFTVTYDNTARKIAEFTQTSNHRYVFYRSDGKNEVVHAGPTWSWLHPGRVLNPTFRYETSTQTIVDLESATKKYTLQCVHGGNSELKSECESFISSFKINP